MSTHVISSIYFQTFNKILANIEQVYLIDERLYLQSIWCQFIAIKQYIENVLISSD